MRSQLRRLIEVASKQPPLEKSQSALALTRIALQHLCLGLAEWILHRYRLDERLELDPDIPFSDLRMPSDGTLAAALPRLLVAAENLGWVGITRPFWAALPTGRPALRLLGGGQGTLEKVLGAFVAERNDGVEGHGIPGARDADAMIDVARLLEERLGHALPVMSTENRFSLPDPPRQPLALSLLRPSGGDLLCYREIRAKPGGKCQIRAQRMESLTDRREEIWESIDVLDVRASAWPLYRDLRTGDPEWRPLVLVPDRLTAHFRGREQQIADLIDWCNDSESRACMLFGDGGIGKTTLILEFVHRLLDGTVSTPWRPELITFYTAKQTRWGFDGLELLRPAPGNVVDLAVSVFRGLSDEAADRAWFDKSAEQVIDRISTYLASEWGIKKHEHLLILDNTETMASSDEDVRLLAKHVMLLSRKVGRVVLTSRRREPIEARQIEVPPLAPAEAVALLRSRGLELGRTPILQAGDAKLRHICERLGSRPLVLEVFLQVLRDHGLSLERAYDRVLQMERQDLGEFLYADAWRRFSARVRDLLLLMTRVADALDEPLIKLCCQAASVSVQEAHDAIAESRGIASVTRIDGQLQVVFGPDFLRYMASKEDWTREVPLLEAVSLVRRRYDEFLRSRDAKIMDRVSLAYRRPFARVAWLAFREERWADCEYYYELAVTEDPTNGLLFDRYAYFLFTRRRFEEARAKADEAIRHAPNDAEPWFTRGMIAARLGHEDQASASLKRAEALGKPRHLCHLQLAYALVNAKPSPIPEAQAALTEAQRSLPQNSPPYLREKHLREVRALETRVSAIARAQKRAQPGS